jgi:hypothetical protein
LRKIQLLSNGKDILAKSIIQYNINMWSNYGRHMMYVCLETV